MQSEHYPFGSQYSINLILKFLTKKIRLSITVDTNKTNTIWNKIIDIKNAVTAIETHPPQHKSKHINTLYTTPTLTSISHQLRYQTSLIQNKSKYPENRTGNSDAETYKVFNHKYAHTINTHYQHSLQ